MSKLNKVNIQGKKDIDDIFYRYQMDLPFIEKSKGKTNISNFAIIASQLARDTKHITNFLKKKWGTSITVKNDIMTTTKDITNNEFNTAIREYIEIYVLCGTCSNPETILTEKKSKIIKDCKSCGSQTSV